MKSIVLSMLMMISWGVYAEEPFPFECKGMSIPHGTVTLPEGAPSLILIHNLSEMDLWVTHPISEPSGASAGWSTRIQSKHWSAFAQGSKAFTLSCIESKPGHEQQVPCSGALAACQWSGMESTDKQSAPPFWAGENMLLPELLSHLEQRGFKLPEPKK